MGSTANLNTGRHNEDWHTHCASSFFIFTLIAQFYNTFISWVVYLNTKAISKNVLYAKTVLAAFVVIQIIYSTQYGQERSFGLTDENLGNDVDKFIEWTLALTVLFGFYIMSLDV